MDNKVCISSDSEKCKDCARLLQDPIGAIKSLPNHICYDAMRQSTENWSSKKLMFPELSEWSAMFPLPVGEKAFLKNLPHTLETLVFADNLPFKGGEEAIFIIEFRFSDALIAFFGLAEFVDTFDRRSGAVEFFEEFDRPSNKPKSLFKHRNPPKNDAYIDKYKFGRCKFVISGDNPTSREVAEAVAKLRHWWAPFKGDKIKGRRPGSKKYKNFQELKDAFERLSPEEKTYALRSQQNFANALDDIDVRTLQRYIEDYRFTWPADFLE
ncbi:hypothetical protein [Candidatus Aquicultor secundus]|uniref:hypothetical protein n=1 Tax=Candidatus Aquicultor secundus TaxID=1973895 RepID=UPI000CB0E436|nr:hypothetical protein [Candidatus Aquicultor secundus]PIU25964.1 MAG: hypothetical protein COT10_11165 [Candidatus Aquicultor secundus]